ncbi:hypothetical protein SCLARK_00930 [Spiroplasma clarkii]|nr:hypothetical protein SCLARK_00930 [Spiroplasma clarkii]
MIIIAIEARIELFNAAKNNHDIGYKKDLISQAFIRYAAIGRQEGNYIEETLSFIESLADWATSGF